MEHFPYGPYSFAFRSSRSGVRIGYAGSFSARSRLEVSSSFQSDTFGDFPTRCFQSATRSSRTNWVVTMSVNLRATVVAPRTCVARRSPRHGFASVPVPHTRSRVVAWSKSRLPREGLSEPARDQELASERALVDGKHVLVLVDAKGARLYCTLFSCDAGSMPERLVPLIRYNHSSKSYDPDLDPSEKARAPQTRASPQTSHQHATSTGKTSHPKSTVLPDAIARAVMEHLKELDPETVLVAAHGKGKGDASKALVAFAKKHAPLLAEKFIGDSIHMESESGGKRLTDAQVLSNARHAYRHALAPKVPLDPAKQTGGFTHGRRAKRA